MFHCRNCDKIIDVIGCINSKIYICVCGARLDLYSDIGVDKI